MAFVIADRVRETSTTTGTGNFTLAGAVDRFRTFDSVLDTGDTTYYTIADQSGVGWEVGIATFTSPSTLARTTILSSSNGGSAVDFGAGSKDVFITLPASRTVISFSGGSTGLTPSTASYGAISLGGTLVAANGGTGQSSYTIGDLLYASGTTALSKLADVAIGSALISGGVGTAPSWGKIGLTTHVSGTLPVANGGTGTTTAFTSGSVVFAGASGVYSQDNSNLFWDDTNNRLGVGTATPVSSIETNGTITAPTLAATNLKHASSASNNIVLDSSGNATFAGTPVPNSSFLRNRIINGDMRIDQRNAGASVTLTNSVGYVVDRFRSVALGTSLGFSTARSTTAPTGFVNSLLATVTTAKNPSSTDQARVNQYIEGFNVSDFGWGTASAVSITLSFWVRSSVIGTYCVAFSNADSPTRSYVGTYTINSSNTWEYKTITVPGDTSGTWTTGNSVGLGVSFSLGCGTSFNAAASGTWYGAEYQQTAAQTLWINNASATFYLTGVQLEVGTAATPFERRQYGQELALCQRYYEKSYNINTVPGSSSDSLRFEGLIGFAKPVSSFNEEFTTRFSVGKRSSTTVVVFNPDTGASGGYRDFTNSVNRTGILILDAGTSGFKALITDAVQEGGGFQFTAAAEL